MEKRKLLLIVISVGVFLVIVIGASILVFAPGSAKPGTSAIGGQAQANAQPAGPASVDASEWVRNPSAVSGFQEDAVPGANGRGDVIIIYGDRPSPSGGDTAPATVTPGDGGPVIEVPAPNAVSVPAPKAESTGQAVTEQKPKTPTPKPAPAKTETVKAAPAPKKATKVTDDFWVQTGSFTAMTRAETAKASLAAKGISSLVETKEVDGKTFYRVRVGPYASKSEAEYWLSLVRTIENFEKSYVSLAKAKR